MKLNLDIIFIPPIVNPVFTRDYLTVPVGVLSLVSSLREKEYSCEVYKPSERSFSYDSLIRIAEDILSHKPRVVGFSCWCNTYPTTILLSSIIKGTSPDTIILFGGPHATIVDKETLHEFPWVDFILRGEAEISIIEFMEEMDNGFDCDWRNVSGLTFRTSGKNQEIVSNQLGRLIENLDQLPIPAYDCAKGSLSIAHIDIGRGCPFSCTFCTTSTFFSRKYRLKSTKRIIQEIEQIHNLYGTTSFALTHDMFTLNKQKVREFCTNIRELREKLSENIIWTCSARIDCVTHELLQEMKQSGCEAIFFGIETGSPTVQKQIKKNLNLGDVQKVIKSCDKLNIETATAFIIGFPGELPKDLAMSCRMIVSLVALGSKPQASILSLLPGTKLYKENKNKIKYDGEFSDFSWAINNTKEHDLIKSYPKIFSSFYYLPITSPKRSVHLILDNLINNIHKFGMTIRLLYPHIKNDLFEMSILDVVESIFLHGKNSLNTHNVTFLLIRKVEAVINKFSHIKHFSLLCDFFLSESSIMLMCSRFTTIQLIAPQLALFEQTQYLAKEYDEFIILPHWCLIETKHNIIDEQNRISNDIKYESKERDATFYISTAISEKDGELVEIEKSIFDLLYLVRSSNRIFTRIDFESWSNQSSINNEKLIKTFVDKKLIIPTTSVDENNLQKIPFCLSKKIYSSYQNQAFDAEQMH